ncbi:glutathione S-transferase family protein [Yoonia sp. BS5-3]|uniref:Glutathione S-transferase family protein n=1 Tax=Yoonia phaeophyticola TaxID=3137369 RepID=A0ABZ2V2A5_9RHOB
MSTPLCLHYAPDNASLCVRLALEELGQPYTTQLVGRSARAQRSPAYLALNPNGLIPVLETPQGPMFETAAILIWLADTYGALMPQPADPARAHALQWMVWLSNTLHPALRMMFCPKQYTDADIDTFRDFTRQTVRQKLTLLNDATHADWLDADSPSIMGCYLGPMLRWATLYGQTLAPGELANWPRLYDFAKRQEARPAASRAAKAEGLGPTPFSAPGPCQPTEGSAL